MQTKRGSHFTLCIPLAELSLSEKMDRRTRIQIFEDVRKIQGLGTVEPHLSRDHSEIDYNEIILRTTYDNSNNIKLWPQIMRQIRQIVHERYVEQQVRGAPPENPCKHCARLEQGANIKFHKFPTCRAAVCTNCSLVWFRPNPENHIWYLAGKNESREIREKFTLHSF